MKHEFTKLGKPINWHIARLREASEAAAREAAQGVQEAHEQLRALEGADYDANGPQGAPE